MSTQSDHGYGPVLLKVFAFGIHSKPASLPCIASSPPARAVFSKVLAPELQHDTKRSNSPEPTILLRMLSFLPLEALDLIPPLLEGQQDAA
jgi:hypothetical protein